MTFLTITAVLVLQPFTAYQPIIDAEPFGSMSATLENTSTPEAIEVEKKKEEIAQKLRMCAVTITPDGETAIGFIDSTTSVTANYVLTIGASANGFKLLDASYEDETATLQKDNIVFTLGLGKGLVADAVPATEKENQPAIQPLRTAQLQQDSENKPAERSHFKRRLLAREAKKQETENKQKRELQNKIAEVEAEKIRLERRVLIEKLKRGETLDSPITLTPAEDAELEKAGIFYSENHD